MSTTAQVFTLLVSLASLAFVIRMVRRRALQSKYSLLWLTIAVGMVVLSVVPDVADRASEAMGVDYPPAAYLALAVAFLFVVLVQYSWELSRLEDRTRVLAEEVALLREVLERDRHVATAGDADDDQRPAS